MLKRLGSGWAKTGNFPDRCYETGPTLLSEISLHVVTSRFLCLISKVVCNEQCWCGGDDGGLAVWTMSSAPPTALPANRTFVIGLLQQWKVSMEKFIRGSSQLSRKQEKMSFSSASCKTSFSCPIGSNVQGAGLDNNNSFYCPSTSGGAPASSCAVSLNFDLWRETKGVEEGGGTEWTMERETRIQTSILSYVWRPGENLVNEGKFGNWSDWFEISKAEFKQEKNSF